MISYVLWSFTYRISNFYIQKHFHSFFSSFLVHHNYFTWYFYTVQNKMRYRWIHYKHLVSIPLTHNYLLIVKIPSSFRDILRYYNKILENIATHFTKNCANVFMILIFCGLTNTCNGNESEFWRFFCINAFVVCLKINNSNLTAIAKSTACGRPLQNMSTKNYLYIHMKRKNLNRYQ